MKRASKAGALRGPGRDTVLDWATGGIVLVLCGTAQLAFLLGPYPFDSAMYFGAAVDPSGVGANLWTLRIGVTAPARAAVLLLGPSEAALYAVPIAVGLVLAAAVYGTMLLLFRDRLVAAGASLVAVLNTNWLLKSSSIFPDTVATATFTAGFFCLVAGARRWEGRGEGWAPMAFALCAGVLFGWTQLARESSLILFPAVLAGLVLLRYPLRRAAILAGAALATASLELLYGFIRYETPFIHARVLLDERHRVRRTPASVVEHIHEQLDSPLETIVLFPRLLLAWSTGWVLLLLIAIFLVGLAARFRDRRLWLLAAWCFSFWIAMAVLGLGSLPSGGWIVNTAIIRYWYPIFPPLVMGAFGAVALLIPERIRLPGGIPGVSAVAVLLASLAVVPGLVEFRQCKAENVWLNDQEEHWSDLRSWFATPEADQFDVVWTDYQTRFYLPAFTSSRFGDPLWEGTAKRLEHGRGRTIPPAGRPRSLILVHRGRSRDVTELAEVRREWSPVFIGDDGEMILLAHTSAPGRRVALGEKPWWRLWDRSPNAWEPGSCGRPYLRAGEPS